MHELTPQHCVERYLFYQASHQWEKALQLVTDKFLRLKYGIFQEHCTEEAAQRYGFASAVEARRSECREFVLRMLKSSTTDADGRNPSHHSIPDNSDCHILVRDHEVIVTLSTPLACSRTRYVTDVVKSGQRKIVDASSEALTAKVR